MAEGFGRHDQDGPSLDGAVLVGFVLVVAASFGAFVYVDDVSNRYDGAPVRVYQHEADIAQGASTDAGPTVDEMTTSSVAAPAAATPDEPKCDVDACADAYRSFRVSDCTFQPYEGPRRLCTR